MMTGNVVAIVAGAVICAVVSYFTNENQDDDDETVWWSTKNIDNPLTPWTQMYTKELDLKDTGVFHDRPSLTKFEKRFSLAKKIAFWGGGLLTLLMVLAWPLAMLENVVMDEGRFLIWTGVSQGWTFIAAAYIIVVPLGQEVMEVYGQYLVSKQRAPDYVTAVSPFAE